MTGIREATYETTRKTPPQVNIRLVKHTFEEDLCVRNGLNRPSDIFD